MDLPPQPRVGDYEIVEYNDGTFAALIKRTFWNTGKWELVGRASTLEEAQTLVDRHKQQEHSRRVRRRWRES